MVRRRAPEAFVVLAFVNITDWEARTVLTVFGIHSRVNNRLWASSNFFFSETALTISWFSDGISTTNTLLICRIGFLFCRDYLEKAKILETQFYIIGSLFPKFFCHGLSRDKCLTGSPWSCVFFSAQVPNILLWIRQVAPRLKVTLAFDGPQEDHFGSEMFDSDGNAWNNPSHRNFISELPSIYLFNLKEGTEHVMGHSLRTFSNMRIIYLDRGLQIIDSLAFEGCSNDSRWNTQSQQVFSLSSVKDPSQCLVLKLTYFFPSQFTNWAPSVV